MELYNQPTQTGELVAVILRSVLSRPFVGRPTKGLLRSLPAQSFIAKPRGTLLRTLLVVRDRETSELRAFGRRRGETAMNVEVTSAPSVMRKCGSWLRLAWPQIVMVLSLSLFFWILVVPDQFHSSIGLAESSPQRRIFMLLALAIAIAVAGWRICFSGRSYLTTRYIRYLAQLVFLTPALFGMGVFVLLASVPQMREIYLVLIDERRWGQGIVGLAAILLLCALLGCWQRSVGGRLLGGIYTDHADLTFDRGLGRVLAFKGNLSSMLPLLGLLGGLFGLLVDATIQVERLEQVDAQLGRQTDGDIRKVVTRLKALEFALPFAAVVAAVFMWLAMFALRRVVTAGPRVSRGILIAGGVVALASILLPHMLGDRTVDLARAIGPLGIVAAALIAIAAFFALMSWVSVRIRVPLTGLFLVVMGGLLIMPMFSAGGGTGKVTRTPFQRPDNSKGLHDDFVKWLESRPDKDGFIKANKPYPVFIVAASGGGIYAASAAATFLAELQDECSTFSQQHVFVISGVSGGAVGASLFNALAAATGKAPGISCTPNRAQSLTDHTEQIVRSDHLSPVVAVLISDIAAKFVGRGETGSGDRADMLQRSFASAFAATAVCRGPVQMAGCQPLQSGLGLTVPFDKHWSIDSLAPALLLNTTWSETGYRVGFAPFKLHAISDGTMFNFNEIAAPSAIERSLIQAAMVSARFPGIVPAWPIDPHPTDGRRQRWNFVDGGYVDNSGSTSALEIFEQIAQYLPPPTNASSLYQRKYPPLGMEIDLRLVLLTDAEPELVLADIQGTGYSDTVAPLKALLQVRSQLSSRAITQTINRIEPGIKRAKLTAREGSSSKVWLVNLEQTVFPLPLARIMHQGDGVDHGGRWRAASFRPA